MNFTCFTQISLLRPLAVVGLAVAGYVSSPPEASAQNVPTTVISGTLPAFTIPGWNGQPLVVAPMPWRATIPTTGWNGTLLLDVDYGNGNSYANHYNRGYGAAGVSRIPFEQGGRDSRVSAMQLMQVLDLFTAQIRKPDYVITNGGSTGGVVSGYVHDHYPDRIDGSVANCTEAGYVTALNARFQGLWLAKFLFGIDLPIRQGPGGAAHTANVAAWRAAIAAAQATAEGKARIALALGLGGMNSWTVGATPPDTSDVNSLQAAMFATLQQLYGADVDTYRNRELQVSGESFLWTTGYDYKKIFNESVRPDQKAVILAFYQRAGLDLEADLQRINNAPRAIANPAAVHEMNLHGDHTGHPQKPIIMNNLVADPLVQTSDLQGYLDQANFHGKGDLVRLTFVNGQGHCAWRANESMAVIDAMNERVRSGVWPDMSPAALNARATAINASLVPRFIAYEDPKYAYGFWTGDEYRVTGCADVAAAKAALGARTGDPRYVASADADRNGVIDLRDVATLSRQMAAGTVCR